jgi:hypothetical protein
VSRPTEGDWGSLADELMKSDYSYVVAPEQNERADEDWGNEKLKKEIFIHS